MKVTRSYSRRVDISEQFPTKLVVIHFDGMTRGLIKPPVPRTHLSCDARDDVGGPIQISGDLQRGDPSLMVRQAPDAA
jgi:hypothetical protein